VTKVELRRTLELGIKLMFRPRLERLKMRAILTNAKVVSSTDFYVRIRAFDGELPVNINVESGAIDSRAGQPTSNAARRRIVEHNLQVFVGIAEGLCIRGAATLGEGLGGCFRQIILRVQDLRSATIRLENVGA